MDYEVKKTADASHARPVLSFLSFSRARALGTDLSQ
jgi:hypothetical protein